MVKTRSVPDTDRPPCIPEQNKEWCGAYVPSVGVRVRDRVRVRMRVRVRVRVRVGMRVKKNAGLQPQHHRESQQHSSSATP
jgi:hypothetical protein